MVTLRWPEGLTVRFEPLPTTSPSALSLNTWGTSLKVPARDATLTVKVMSTWGRRTVPSAWLTGALSVQTPHAGLLLRTPGSCGWVRSTPYGSMSMFDVATYVTPSGRSTRALTPVAACGPLLTMLSVKLGV